MDFNPTPTPIDDCWKRVFVYLRKLGCRHSEAEDLTQDIFCRLIAKNQLEDLLEGARREQASKYLIVAARNAYCDKLRRSTAAKRSGRVLLKSLERPKALELETDITPADELEWSEVRKHWDHQVAQMLEETTNQGKRALFNLVKDQLIPGHRSDLQQVAAFLDLNPATVRVQAHRWRTMLITRVRDAMKTRAA